MKNPVFTLFFVLLALPLPAQVNSIFPGLSGETLTGKAVTVPGSLKGKPALLAVAYSRKSQELLEQWFAPVYRTFINPPKEVFVPVDQYDIHTYFIPMIKGLEQVASDKIVEKMQANFDPELQDNVLVYSGGIGQYKKDLKLGKKDLPYFFVLDPEGKILHATSGAYNDGKLAEIKAVLEKYIK